MTSKTTDDIPFSNLLSQNRKKMGLCLKEVCSKTNRKLRLKGITISVPTLCVWEKGEHLPPPLKAKELEPLASVLNIELKDLLQAYYNQRKTIQIK